MSDDKEKFGIIQDIKTDHFRKIMGLRQVKRGDRYCLSCNKKFFSLDLASIRCCEYCREKEE